MVEDVPDLDRDLHRWIKEKLFEHGIRLRKSLSQVLLLNPRVLEKISLTVRNVAKLHGYRSVIEIGAGPGTLTLYLVKNCSDVNIVAVEIDSRFAPILQLLQKRFENLDIVIGDAIKLLESMNCPMVVGNLPYHITSDLLIRMARKTQTALIMVQKDVAEKILSKPGSKSYGKLSILMQLVFDIEYLGTVPARFFKPRPEVSSSILLLERKRRYDEIMDVVEEILKCFFSYRRKNVYKVLNRCFPSVNVEKLCTLLNRGLCEKRVFQLSPEDIEALAKIIAGDRDRVE